MKKIIYEITIGILAVIAVILAIIDFSKGLVQWQIVLDDCILIIFIVDYLIRLFISQNKKNFLKNNIFDLISIIPFNSAFRIFRIIKLTKILRILKIIKLSKIIIYSIRLFKKFKKFFNTNGFKYIICITIIFIILGGCLIHYAENMPFQDGIWWAFVTATTVGYGDISPHTILGRIIATVLMLIGIGLIGSLTSTITSYFLCIKTKTVKDEIIENIKNKIDDINNLSEEDINNICKILKSLKN
jgi:voltage-gated potassium channel